MIELHFGIVWVYAVSHHWAVCPLVIKAEYYFGVKFWWVFL